MVASVLVDIALGFVIGLVLGFLGGGGSILTVPALVYIVGQSPQTAVTASLVIVGANATMGALVHRRQGTLDWRVALLFGGAGMATAYLAAGWSKSIPSPVLLALFAALMLVVGGMMLFGKKPVPCKAGEHRWLLTLAGGAGVGALTGFLGVGGGFLIVPALVMLVGLPIGQAVGTSLIVIAMNSLAGLLGHLDGGALDMSLLAIFVAAGLAGVLSGAKLAHIIRPEQLRASFAIFVVLLGVILLVDNLSKLI